jgi:class 3 adenylate cyclase/tetratricopeptide (TPR) repeat protein
MEQNNHQLAAILFTDIVGYTKRMEQDEERTMQLLQQQREIVFPIVESHGGKVIKEIGDGLLIMFHSAIHAVRCAISIQERLKDEELTIRAGIHIGDVIFKDGDVFGSAVNTAARIEPLAPANGICISEQVRSQIRNKDDIQTFSMGKKELKGVDRPIEIFCIASGTIDLKKPSTVSIFKDLWKRKVLQIAMAYLALSWIIKLAVSSIVTSFMLSPYLVDLVWIILLSLSPTVLLITYFHGKTKEKWNRIEKIGLPLNLLATILLAVFMFNGKDLGAATESVIIEDEGGNKIEREVIKSEFRKKLALYFFENKSADPELDWLQYGLPVIINYDLSQNIYIRTKTGTDLINKFRDANYEEGVGAPLILLSKIADYYGLNYFCTGSFTFENKLYSITSEVYRTKDANLVNSSKMEGDDLFELVDKISKQLMSDMNLPGSYIEKSKDLRVSDIFTNKVEAFENFINGNLEILFYNRWDSAINLIESALVMDPSFTLAEFKLAELYFNSNNVTDAETLLNNVVHNNLYKLPERQQYLAKFFYYILKQEADKAIAVLKMWADLMPDDIQPHEELANRYQYKNDFQSAIKEYKIILNLDPDQTAYIRYIGELYRAMKEVDSALAYYNQYVKLNPDDYKAYRSIGELFLYTADFDKAKENIDYALVMEPGDIDLALTSLILNIKTGHYQKLENKYQTLLKRCKSANDSALVYNKLSDYYESQGKVNLALNEYKKYLHCIERFANPLNYNVQKMFRVDKYVNAGQMAKAYEIIKESENLFEPPVDKIISFGYMLYYLYIEEPLKSEPYIEEARELAIGFGEEMLLNNVYYVEGHIFEAKEKYEKALESFNLFLDQSADGMNIYKHIARIYRKMGELKEAKKSIQIALKHYSFNAKVNYEAYLIYKESGEQNKALEYLQRSCEIWKDADDVYKPAKTAKDELAELGV